MSLGLAVARTVLAIVPNEKFGGSELMVLGSFAKVVLDPLIPVKGTLQHTKTFRTISCSLPFRKSLGMGLCYSNMTVHQCSKQAP